METPKIKKAKNALEFLSQDKEVRRLYEARQKALLDKRSALGKARREGYEKGYTKGVKDAKNRVAIKLLERGMNESEVMALTELTKTEVKELNPRA